MKRPLRFTAKLLTFLALLSQMTFLFSGVTYGQAETRQLKRETTTVKEETRIALVIGNSDYKFAKSLPNPVNDAKDVSDKLRSLGFEVYSGTNQSKQDMMQLIRDFGTRLVQTQGVGLFFYAGHGLQYRGNNYLVPIDADIASEDEIEYESVDVGRLLAKMEAAKNNLNIIILDACRNNPFASKWNVTRDAGDGGGLAKMDAPSGSYLIFATEPGKVASDGEGRNGLFTSSLLNNIDKPNITLERLTKLVGNEVKEKSKNVQIPWTQGLVLGDFYFVKPDEKPAVKPSVTESAAIPQTNNSISVPPTSANARLREDNAWNSVKNSINRDDFKFFLEEFPNGVYSFQAKVKIEMFDWDEIKYSTDKSKISAFLEKYPDGLNSGAAKIKLRQLEANATIAVVTPPVESKPEPKVEDAPIEKEPTKNREVVTEKPAPTKAEKADRIENIIKNSPVSVKKNLPAGKLIGKLPKVTSQTDNVGIEFILIPAGGFMMGASSANVGETLRMARKDYADFESAWIEMESPAHRVEIPEAFWMGKTEVTQAQWEKVMGSNPSFRQNCLDCPVDKVSWNDAKAFINKLNELNNGFVYSLPSEAEWEYAARGGTTRLFAGNVEEISWHNGNSGGETNPVALRLPNSFGIYDMNGNVAEWCEDLYERYDKTGNPEVPSNPTKLRVIRGGHWGVFPTLQRSTARSGSSPDMRNISTGFRLVARLKQ